MSRPADGALPVEPGCNDPLYYRRQVGNSSLRPVASCVHRGVRCPRSDAPGGDLRRRRGRLDRGAPVAPGLPRLHDLRPARPALAPAARREPSVVELPPPIPPPAPPLPPSPLPP